MSFLLNIWKLFLSVLHARHTNDVPIARAERAEKAEFQAIIAMNPLIFLVKSLRIERSFISNRLARAAFWGICSALVYFLLFLELPARPIVAHVLSIQLCLFTFSRVVRGLLPRLCLDPCILLLITYLLLHVRLFIISSALILLSFYSICHKLLESKRFLLNLFLTSNALVLQAVFLHITTFEM